MEMDRKGVYSFTLKSGATTITQYRCVALSTTNEGEITNCAANEDNVVGVLVDTSLAADKLGAVQTSGIAKIEVASSVTEGDMLYVSNSSGQVAPFVPGTTPSGVSIVGKCLKDASTQAYLTKVLLTVPTMYHS